MGQPQHHTGAAQVSAAGVADDTEWEYEYDDNQTEEFYFTLDLTTHVPDALVRKHDTAPDAHANTTSAQEPPEADAQNENATIEDPPPTRKPANTKPRNALQILDLHTRNPLVKFDDGVYSCYWSTDLGTQFHVSQAGVTSNPRRAGTVLDIVGLSQTRLIGKPITLTQKDFNADGIASNAAASNEDETVVEPGSDQAASGANNSATQPLIIPRNLCKNLTAETQASFLERLSQIKLKKGETDPLPIYSIKYHQEPSNKEELKKSAKAADAGKRKVENDGEVAIGGSHKRRKRLTAAEKGTVPDDDARTGGRRSREAIGARVGFSGQAPGALSTKRKGKEVAAPEHSSETAAGDFNSEDVAAISNMPQSTGEAGSPPLGSSSENVNGEPSGDRESDGDDPPPTAAETGSSQLPAAEGGPTAEAEVKVGTPD